MAKSVHLPAGINVHVRPDWVFTLRRNRCSLWAGIRNSEVKILTERLHEARTEIAGLTATLEAEIRQKKEMKADIAALRDELSESSKQNADIRIEFSTLKQSCCKLASKTQ